MESGDFIMYLQTKVWNIIEDWGNSAHFVMSELPAPLGVHNSRFSDFVSIPSRETRNIEPKIVTGTRGGPLKKPRGVESWVQRAREAALGTEWRK